MAPRRNHQEKLESQMVFDMSDLVTLTKKSINESLNQTMGNGIKTQGKLKSLELVDWSLQKDAIWVEPKHSAILA